MSIDPTRHFAADYSASRVAFLRAAEARSARISSHPLAERGQRGEELAIDVAYIGAQAARRLVIVTSGTHGVEGFAGGAIQHRLLTEQLDGLQLTPDMGILLLHAVNPYGFAHLRRVNENNVDLNRNFLRHPEEHVPNPDYDALFDAINPDSLEPERERANRARLSEFARQQGPRRLQEVLACGQYAHRVGVQFGGFADEASNRLVREILRNAAGGTSQIAWIDLHTGLGPWCEYEMISQAPPDDPAFLRGRSWYGDATRSTVSGESVTPLLYGDILDGVLMEFPAQAAVTALAPEFGTYDLSRVFLALRADNWLHHHGYVDSEEGKAIRGELLEVFRPASAEWQAAVLAGGALIVQQTVDGLARSEI